MYVVGISLMIRTKTYTSIQIAQTYNATSIIYTKAIT